MNTSHQRGFSMLELMVAVTVLGILFGIGVPSFNAMIRNNRVASNTNEIVLALSVARSEAVRRGLPVSVCAATTPTSSTCVAAGASNWANGWIVFTDATGAAGAVNGPADAILQRFDGVPNGIALTSNSHGFVRFAATGLPTSVETIFTLKHSQCTGNNRRMIKLTITGRVNTNKVACS